MFPLTQNIEVPAGDEPLRPYSELHLAGLEDIDGVLGEARISIPVTFYFRCAWYDRPESSERLREEFVEVLGWKLPRLFKLGVIVVEVALD